MSFAELAIVFVGRAADGSKDPVTRGLEGCQIPFLFTTFDLPADQAIDRAIEEDIADLEASRDKFTEPDRILVIDHAIARHRSAAPTLRQAMSLVLNALAFRKAYPEDQIIVWPAGSPQRMIDQASNLKFRTS